MKRILGMIFLLFFGICGTVGGVALFSGCSQSQVENGGGGTFVPPQNENEEIDNPNYNENYDDNQNEDESGGEDDDEISANLNSTDYTFKIFSQLKDSSSSHTNTSSSTNYNVFYLQWKDSNGTRQPFEAGEKNTI